MFRKNSSLSFAQKKQSVKGTLSIVLAAVAWVICIVAVVLSYRRDGNAGKYIGGCGIMALLSAVMGFCFGIGGILEGSNARLAAWIGTVLSLLILVGLVLLFIIGL